MRNMDTRTFVGKTVFFLVLFAVTSAFMSIAWAGWTDRTEHDRGLDIKYKNRSWYTGPADYAPDRGIEVAAPEPKAGRCNQYTFDGTKSFDADGQKLTYLWDFGDGTTSDKAVVTHSYDKAGNYQVSLTVKDSSGSLCGNGIARKTVSPNFAPVPAASNQQGCLGQVITFDAGGTTASGPASYTWDFGDGTTAEGVKVTHAYQKEGRYRVVLNVNDGKNTECSQAATAVVATVAPTASVILKSPEASCAGRSVRFESEATGGSVKYHWDFGDGTIAEGGSSMAHVYQKGGDYTVSVSVDNGQGFSCSTATDSKKIKINESPKANAGDNLVCCVGKEAVFDGSKSTSSAGTKLTYEWNFGDGASSDQVKTSHAYAKPGNYRVVLTVKDDSGSECGIASDSFVASVNSQPEAVIDIR